MSNHKATVTGYGESAKVEVRDPPGTRYLFRVDDSAIHVSKDGRFAEYCVTPIVW